MKKLSLTPPEAHCLALSARPEMVRRRRTMGILSGFMFAGVTVVAGVTTQSWKLLTAMAVGYIVLANFERLMNASALLAHKSLIRKLVQHIQELECEKLSPSSGEEEA